MRCTIGFYRPTPLLRGIGGYPCPAYEDNAACDRHPAVGVSVDICQYTSALCVITDTSAKKGGDKKNK